MQLTIASLAAALVAPALAQYSNTLQARSYGLGSARVHNRCDYTVYLWSVKKDMGCSSASMKTLKPGESYSEVYRDDGGPIGTSIKISKTEQCKGVDITQLEYHINNADPKYYFNFLDVSFVDCLGGECPCRDKFYLKSGNNGDVRLATAGADKAQCPILSCKSKAECATMAYILPDDVQTKSCAPDADMDFYMCVDNPDEVTEEPSSSPAPVPSSTSSSSSSQEPEPTTSKEEDEYTVAVAAASEPEITPPPKKAPNVKTQVQTVYVTEYAYVHAKRHAHGHAHKHFKA